MEMDNFLRCIILLCQIYDITYFKISIFLNGDLNYWFSKVKSYRYFIIQDLIHLFQHQYFSIDKDYLNY